MKPPSYEIYQQVVLGAGKSKVCPSFAASFATIFATSFATSFAKASAVDKGFGG